MKRRVDFQQCAIQVCYSSETFKHTRVRSIKHQPLIEKDLLPRIALSE